MPGLIVIAMRQQAGANQVDERTRFRAEELALAHDDTIATLGKELAQVAYGQALTVGFRDADACDDVPRLLAHRPSAVELVPRMIIRLARGVPEYARQMGWVIGDPAALLVVEFSGDEPSLLREAARKIGDVLTIAESKEDQARVWNVRKVGLGLMDSRPQSARPVAFIEDCAIPVQRLGEFVREVETILAAHGTEGGIYAHASAGCLHIRPILDLKTTRGVTDLRSISRAVFALTLKLGGAMSSEHGDGLARSEYLEQTYGRELADAMRLLKRAADPKNLLNPGKITDAPKMDENLRYGADYHTRVWETSLSFTRNGRLDVAIHITSIRKGRTAESSQLVPAVALWTAAARAAAILALAKEAARVQQEF